MDVFRFKQILGKLSKIDSLGNRGQVGETFQLVFGGVILFVMSVILLYNVALPQVNTAIVSGQPLLNTTNSSGPGYLACLSNCGGANLSGYSGTIAISQATYVVALLSSLAAGAGLVFLFIRGEF